MKTEELQHAKDLRYAQLNLTLLGRKSAVVQGWADAISEIPQRIRDMFAPEPLAIIDRWKNAEVLGTDALAEFSAALHVMKGAEYPSILLACKLDDLSRPEKWQGTDATGHEKSTHLLLDALVRLFPGTSVRERSERLLHALETAQDLDVAVRDLATRAAADALVADSVREQVVANLKNQGGLEEPGREQMAQLAEAAQGPGVVVIETDALVQRAGLEDLVARLPAALGQRVLLYGSPEDLRVREWVNGVTLVPRADGVPGLAATLMGRGAAADRVTVVGARATADTLRGLLPASMDVAHRDPAAGLEEILLAVGVPADVLKQINPRLLDGTRTLREAA